MHIFILFLIQKPVIIYNYVATFTDCPTNPLFQALVELQEIKYFINVFYLFSSTPVLSHIIKLTRVNVVDNSELGKPYKRRPTCIGLYRKKKVATVGDTILLAIRGQKQKALIVGCKQYQKPNVPKFDANNVILIDDAGSPIGTRVKVPVPSLLRGWKDTAKIVAIAKRFV